MTPNYAQFDAEYPRKPSRFAWVWRAMLFLAASAAVAWAINNMTRSYQ